MNLGELASHGPTMEIVNRLLSEILTPGDVHGRKPAAPAPAPRRNGRNTNLLQPAVQADDCCRTDWIILIMYIEHAGILQIWQRLGVDSPMKTRVLFFRFRRTTAFARCVPDAGAESS